MNANAAKRLVVAVDVKPGDVGRRGARIKFREIADNLAGTGAVIKANSVLRALGYDLIDECHAQGLEFCADLKVFDVPDTISNDAAFLRECKPEFLTVATQAGVEGMKRLQDALPETEFWGVTILTTFDNVSCDETYRCTPADGVLHYARLAKKAGLKGLILSPKEAAMLRDTGEFTGMSLNSPGIRYPWSEIGDQKRFLTAGEAIRNGIHRVVVGGPILKAQADGIEGHPQSRREAFEWVVKDIEQALAG